MLIPYQNLKPIFEKQNKGPLQIVHDFRFTALNVKDDYSFLDTASHLEKLCHMKKRVYDLYEMENEDGVKFDEGSYIRITPERGNGCYGYYSGCGKRTFFWW